MNAITYNRRHAVATELNDRSISTIFVAIEISKFSSDILIQKPGKKHYRMQITNEHVNHDHFIKHLSDIPCTFDVGFEAAGSYHRPIAWRLPLAVINVHLVSCMALVRTCEAFHNSWDKNDSKDTQVMLYIPSAGYVQRCISVGLVTSSSLLFPRNNESKASLMHLGDDFQPADGVQLADEDQLLFALPLHVT